ACSFHQMALPPPLPFVMLSGSSQPTRRLSLSPVTKDFSGPIHNDGLWVRECLHRDNSYSADPSDTVTYRAPPFDRGLEAVGALSQQEGGSTMKSLAPSHQDTTATLKVGDPAPDFELPGTGGRTVRLSDFRGKKNVFIAF